MKICVVSHSFSPAIGGVEAVASTLCTGLTKHHHEVILLTRTAADNDHDMARSYTVIRQPTKHQVLDATRKADVVLHNNPVARWLWASIATRRPTVLVHHTWLANGRSLGPTSIKRRLMSQFVNVAVSDVLARSLDALGRIQVVPNSFDEQIFSPRITPGSDDFIFVGRLVDDKGCDLLLEAWKKASERLGARILRIIGDGPERDRLHEQAQSLRLNNVRFLGPLEPPEVARNLRDCHALVAPSRWREPFGLVALEAAASGCQVVAPSDTGLVEAAGPAMLGFKRGDATSLSHALIQAAHQPAPETQVLSPHLDRHRGNIQIQNYINIMESARRTRGHQDATQVRF